MSINNISPLFQYTGDTPVSMDPRLQTHGGAGDLCWTTAMAIVKIAAPVITVIAAVVYLGPLAGVVTAGTLIAFFGCCAHRVHRHRPQNVPYPPQMGNPHSPPLGRTYSSPPFIPERVSVPTSRAPSHVPVGTAAVYPGNTGRAPSHVPVGTAAVYPGNAGGAVPHVRVGAGAVYLNNHADRGAHDHTGGGHPHPGSAGGGARVPVGRSPSSWHTAAVEDRHQSASIPLSSPQGHVQVGEGRNNTR